MLIYIRPEPTSTDLFFPNSSTYLSRKSSKTLSLMYLGIDKCLNLYRKGISKITCAREPGWHRWGLDWEALLAASDKAQQTFTARKIWWEVRLWLIPHHLYKWHSGTPSEMHAAMTVLQPWRAKPPCATIQGDSLVIYSLIEKKINPAPMLTTHDQAFFSHSPLVGLKQPSHGSLTCLVWQSTTAPNSRHK